MTTGLLWFDNDPGRDLAQKVAQAAYRYYQKFGVVPDTCYVHQDTLLKNEEEWVGSVRVMTLSNVLRHHYWIGQRQERKSK